MLNKSIFPPLKNILQCIVINLGLNGRDGCGLASIILSRSCLILTFGKY